MTADQHRAAISLIGKPLKEINARFSKPSPKPALIDRIPHPDNALGRYVINEIEDTWFRFRSLVRAGGLGRHAIKELEDTLPAILKRWLRDQTSLSATQAWLAVSLYEREHRELPATLNELVPAYLPAVPRDYFDGGSIRYSRDLGVIWSVGEKNLNITEPHQVIEQREVVLYLTPRP